ncbi:TlpA family protein disulfide reductase [Chloroflexota bacterium]
MVSLSDLQGKPVMLNFWATWCGPCRFEMPFVQEVFEDRGWSDQGLVLLTVDSGESSSKVGEFMKDNDYSFPVILDTKRNIVQKYSVRGIPTTFFIDKEGIIKDVKIGAFPNKSELESKLSIICR